MGIEELDPLDIESLHISQSIPAKKDVYDEVLSAKQAFIETGKSQLNSRYIRPIIARSWERSVNQGIDPGTKDFYEKISEEDYRSILIKHEKIVKVAEPLLRVVDDLELTEDYVFEFVSAGGLSLYHSGNLSVYELSNPRKILRETTAGTNAHSLCVRHKTAIQVFGPEHYCNALNDIVASAAPIFNESGNVVATLLLTHPLPEHPWPRDYSKILRHTLGLLASLASAIEYQVKFQYSQHKLKHLKAKIQSAISSSVQQLHLLESAIRSVRDGIIVLDDDYKIKYATSTVASMLNSVPSALVGTSVYECFGMDNAVKIEAILENKKPTNIEAANSLFLIWVTDVLNKDTRKPDGYIMHIQKRSVKNQEAADKSDTSITAITFDDLSGSSLAVVQALEKARKYARSQENILLVDKNGTGKEPYARAIHNDSRPEEPFVVVNCSGIHKGEFEQVFFGKERVTCTELDGESIVGKFEQAKEGTLFIDEIESLPLSFQANLLGALESGYFKRIGGSDRIAINARIITATTKDFSTLVLQDKFRDDLLFCLGVLNITLPPLNKCPDDVAFLARRVLNECNRLSPGGPFDFSSEAMRLIETYRWPGNVRELNSAIVSAYYMSEGDVIRAEELPCYIQKSLGYAQLDCDDDYGMYSVGHFKTLDERESEAIEEALRRTNNNISKASEMLGIGRATLYRKLREDKRTRYCDPK